MTFIKKIFAVNLALLVFISTTSFSVHAHFCGERLHAIGVVKKAVSCGCLSAGSTCIADECSSGNTHSTHSKSCCKDLTILNEGQNTLMQVFMANELKPQIKMLLTLPAFLYNSFDTPDEISYISKYQNITPPLIEPDIHLLVQSFLL